MTNLAQTPLSDRLRTLVDTVQHNERTLRRFQNVELRLIGSQDFSSFLDTLFCHLPQEFALASVRLWLDDRAPMLLELLEPGALQALGQTDLKTSREGGLAAQRLCAEGRPWLGQVRELDERACRAFFGEDDLPASAIVLPLAVGDNVSGYLCLGSDDPARFGDGMATDILERFASIVTASLDNVAHRERLKQLGMTDALTGLANRRYFDERLREEIMRAVRYAVPVACLFIDIDSFKRINDTYGHQTGDRALAAVAACVRQQVRLGDTVARYGGEEFAALLQGDRSDALTVAERVRLAVEKLDLRDDHGERIALTVSIGVAARTIAGAPADTATLGRAMMDEADRAMYQAKRNGRNRIEAMVQAAGDHVQRQ
ncbi:GGDEF domain-containing protein [Paraburkholderia lacunae]|uniref:diguanylate cyclase n=1 Tax=Paraburkholderia lacunae TaxID=2211104 RepID=A0A370N1S4_9BURK|nr:GGDEF domain-containing protein [Paraburkholderia lacunae]RDJ99575.1 GGDEF domain-containing protein [Paraburkholderia lacunae]